MNKKQTLHTFLLVSVFAIFFVGCKKDVHQNPIKESLNADPVLSYIKSLGFQSAMIQDVGKEYLVEGDISFPKDMKLPSKQGIPGQSSGGSPRERIMSLPPNHDLWIEQYFTGNLVSTTTATNIKILVDGSMASLSSEINSAISQWNNIPNSTLHFSIVTSGGYDIYMTDQNLGSGLCGVARFPINGTPGNLIRINKNEIAGNSFDQRQRTIAHEMGHCIGFRHTNWQGNGESQYGSDDVGTSVNAIDVPGVGGTDASSIMNGGQCGSGATQLSAKDKLAAAALYPASGSSGPGVWQLLPGQGRDIGVGADGSVYKIGVDEVSPTGGNSISKWNGNSWSALLGPTGVGYAGYRIAVDPQGKAWVVNKSNLIFKFNGSTFDPIPGQATDIGIGADGSVYKIGVDEISPTGGYSISKWNGSSWSALLGPTGVGYAGFRIAVDPQGKAWVVNKSNLIFRFNGSTFDQIPGQATDIGIGADGSVYKIGVDEISPTGGYSISKWNGSAWQVLSDTAGINISVNPQGKPWITNKSNSIYYNPN